MSPGDPINDLRAIWAKIDETHDSTIQNGAKLDGLAKDLERIAAGLYGNGQPGLRERVFKIEKKCEECEQRWQHCQENDRLKAQLGVQWRVAILTGAIGGILGAINFLVVAYHAIAG